MSNEGSVAPRERVNITYRPATGGAQEEVELPFKMLMVGDFQGGSDERRLEERKPIHVDKDNFARVLEEQDLRVELAIKNRLAEGEAEEMQLCLRFSSLKDFTPEGIAEQVPELRALLDLRNALTALKGPLGNLPAFRRKIQELLSDDHRRGQLAQELLLTSGEDDGVECGGES